ncbi:MAG TPA: tRNA 2-thiouridine(34) synthase MnmA [Solirubrobacteraceae bacterium]|nr:tRNA 2-thiouridine(34) synthase MnmA [Solirubrobacteraceae bacterium]
MDVEAFSAHLQRPLARGHTPTDAHTGAAGGAACGDLVRISLRIDSEDPDGRIADAGFDASGCGTALAAGSAAVALVRDRSLLAAARVGAGEIAAELGGLGAAKLHAAELAADALARALGAAARAQARLAPCATRTLVAMSGGVDSAVAALLVANGGGEETERGGDSVGAANDVVAVTLELWADPENDGEGSCCSAQAVRSARDLAQRLGLAHFSIDLRDEFRAGVVAPWLSDHAAGLTPNPCVRCNGEVRLDAMLDLAERLGAQALATGHYARVHDGLLRVAVDEGKDQSYALAALSPQSLERMRFPLGSLTKPQVRELAARAGLAVAKRPDSQDLCFLAGTSHGAFLARHGAAQGLGERPGQILDTAGRVLGEHRGVHTVTIGQRHGLGIGGGAPLYVIATDARSNTVTVGAREQLRAARFGVRDVTLHRDGGCVDAVKVRYRGRRVPCRIDPSTRAGAHPRVDVLTADPQERTAPGQMACLYAGDTVVGYGTITA